MSKNFRLSVPGKPVLRIRRPHQMFEKEEDPQTKQKTTVIGDQRYIDLETELLNKQKDIALPGTNPVTRTIAEPNTMIKKDSHKVDNRFLKSSLENNPYYMKDQDDGLLPDSDEKSAGSSRSMSRDSKKSSKMHQTAKDFFERNNLHGIRDVSKYDCWDQDLEPHQWMEKCDLYPERLHGFSPFYVDGRYQWQQVKVIDYDQKQAKFLVKEPKSGIQKYVERLSLMFMDENKELFKDRVLQWKFYQKRAEDEMRFQSYAEKVDDGMVSSLNEKWIKQIKDMALNKRRKQADENMAHVESFTNKMIMTVQAEYVREMKKRVVLNEMLDKNKREKFHMLKIPVRHEIRHAEMYGTIVEVPDVVSDRFKKCRGVLISQMYYPDRAGLLNIFIAKSVEFLKEPMFDLKPPQVDNPLTINGFTRRQVAAYESNKTNINKWKGDIIAAIEDAGLESMKGNYTREDLRDSGITSAEADLRVVQRIDLFFRSRVKHVAEVNLKSYVSFLRKFVMPDVLDDHSPVWEVLQQPLITLTILTIKLEKDKDGKEKQKKLSNEECIFFEPTEEEIFMGIKEPIKQLITSINSIASVETTKAKWKHHEEKPIYQVSEETPSFQLALEEVDGLLKRAFEEPLRILSKFRDNSFLLKKSAEDIVKQHLDKKDSKDKKAGKEKNSVEELDRYMQQVEDSIRSIQEICTNQKNTVFFMLQTGNSKKILVDKANEIKTALLTRIGKMCIESVTTIYQNFENLSQRINSEPQNEQEYNDLMQIIDNNDKMSEKYHERVIEKLEAEIDEVGKYFDLLLKYSRELNHSDRENYFLYWALKRYPEIIKKQAKLVATSSEKAQKYALNFKAKVTADKEQLAKKITKLEKEFEWWKKVGIAEWKAKYTENNDFHSSIASAIQDRKLLNERERLLDVEACAFENLNVLQTNDQPYLDLRRYTDQLQEGKSTWSATAIVKLRYKEVYNKIEELNRNLTRSMKNFESLEAIEAATVCNELLKDIQEFRVKLPIIYYLTKDAIIKKNNYWNVDLMQALGFAQNQKIPQNTVTLNELVDNYKMLDHMEAIEEVCTKAEKEYDLEIRYNEEVIEVLKKLRLPYLKYKSTDHNIISGVDEIVQIIDEKLTILIGMKQNPNIKPIKPQVETTEKKLRGLQDMFDKWVRCQRDWIYLEPIFTSDEIAKDMADSSNSFNEVNEAWKKLMDSVVQDNLFYESLDWDKTILTLSGCNTKLDKIQKNLSDFLGMRREEFPRFYFLSDEELLEILSKSKDPTLVTKYMKKCFEAIESIDFNPQLEVLNMKSSEKEVVEFLRPVVTNQGDRKGRVEKWLNDVEAMMRDTLIKSAINCSNDTTERTKWVFKWPGQIIIAINNCRWTAGVEDAIKTGNGELEKFVEKLIREREDVVDIVKGDITPLQRMTLAALIVIDQHAIHVTEMLVKSNIATTMDFDWISQLRYYMSKKDKDKLKVSMITSTLNYQYEYLGNSDRLVITPLTDRCYRTLMGAFQYNYGGAPEGPAGTGKTETVKDLAKAIAVQCVVFNCSDQINTVAMNKFFKGLSQCGSWCCFDEFNRIFPEVLSVIAEQVRVIQSAIREGKNKFLFDGVQCRLNGSAFTCITMNPGYAGRSELPDNLKAIFRACAMMVPDYSLISEIVLFSYGYQTATSLAKKIVASLRLSSEQLSSQKHYDFGMRALKAILVAAGNLKKKNPNEDEAKLCIRALFDVNLPKFTQNDIPLFQSITSDLFTDTKPPITNYDSLIEKFGEVAKAKQVILEPVVIKKCIETYETLLVRHGLMLVGHTCSSKTTVLNILRDSLSALDGQADYIRTKDFWLNPKAVDSYQLFGKLDQNTKLWTDGILPHIMRHCENEADVRERKWIVFDGPVDAVWIENMNTVLDDNKILCLTNGQKIKVSSVMSMMFEVEDLDNASPATVSRCGMVYLEPRQLGWRPLVMAYTNFKLAKPLQGVKGYLEKTLKWFLTPSLEYVRKNCKFPFMVDSMQMTMSVLKIFDALCEPYHATDFNGTKEGKEGEALINNFCLFSVLWGVGGVVEEGRNEFNKFLMNLIYCEKVHQIYNLDLDDPNWEPRGLSYNLNDANNLYEIMYDSPTNTWIPWMKTIPKWQAPAPETAYNELIVPTSDTIRNSFFINLMIMSNNHVLLTGPTGTAKTISSMNEINMRYRSKNMGNTQIVFSGQTNANQVQDIIETKMNFRLKKGHFGPEEGLQKLVLFIDDVNMPAKDEYGAQPPIELLRMWADHGFLYEHLEREKKYFHNMQLLCTMGPPSSGRNMITRRMLRHFFILFTEPFDDKSLTTIFSSILDWYFAGMKGKLPSAIVGLKDQIIDGTIAVYTKVMARLLPTPKKSHYIYNLRDVSRVIQGITRATAKSFSDPNDLIKLWAHECMRVFSDRLVSKEDLDLFEKDILKPVMTETFKKSWDSIVKFEPLLFASFIPTKHPDNDPNKPALTDIYCELVNRDNLIKESEKFLSKYNEGGSISDSGVKDKLNLVLFMTAIEHLVRVVRILSTPLGHALLVGVGGSGKRSLAKLATFIVDFDRFTIDVTKSYDFKKDWVKDMIELLRKCGVDNRPTNFLMVDTQIFKEIILEHISSVLNQGEIPSVFKEGEKDFQSQIFEAFPQETETMSPAQKNEFFIKNCKKNLHLVLCFSPVGEQFRKRLRTFPSLINCTTIDWFLPWPNDALRSVARALLKDTELKPEQVTKVSDIFVAMQEKVVDESRRYLEEMKKYYYVTPTSYIELVKLFKKLLSRRQQDSEVNINRYRTGLVKINEAEHQVKEKRKELEALKPELQTSTEETEKLLVKVQKEQIEADKEKIICMEDEKVCNKIKDEATKLKGECEIQVKSAEEILQQSQKELETLDRSSIDELKVMKAPTEAVKHLFRALCIILNEDIKMVKDPADPMKKIPDLLTPIRSVILKDSNKALTNMKTFTEDRINKEINQTMIDKIKVMMEKEPEFTAAKLKISSQAAAAMFIWLRAIIQVFEKLQIVNPMREELRKAQAQADDAEAQLKSKKDNLQRITNMIDSLKEQATTAENKKIHLKKEVERCTRQLNAAEELTKGFGTEKESWKNRAQSLENTQPYILGESLLAASVVAFLGVFPLDYRNRCVENFTHVIKDKHIQLDDKLFSLRRFCVDEMTVNEWVEKFKLPNDSISVENAVIIQESNRYSLIIDPQLQASRYIKEFFGTLGLKVLRPNMNATEMEMTITNCIVNGFPLLAEGVEVNLDSMYENIFDRSIEIQGKKQTLMFMNKPLDLHRNFRFFATTKLSRPHYPPETCAKVTLINFTVTPEGLEDQLVNLVVALENAALELKKQQAIKKISESNVKQKETEKTILSKLSEQEGNILDNEPLIATLNESKRDAAAAIKENEASEKTKKKFNDLCVQYREVGYQISHLFFCVMDLANVEPMYQFSLEWFIDLYEKSVKADPKSKDIPVRVKDIIALFTETLFIKVCRSLFERDKLLFSFLIFLKRLVCNKLSTNNEIRKLLLTIPTKDAKEPNPTSWLTPKQWSYLCELSEAEDFRGLAQDFVTQKDEWTNIYEAEQPQTMVYPGKWASLTSVQKLIVMRTIRPDKIMQMIQDEIPKVMKSRQYVEFETFSLETVFKDSRFNTPIVFILSPGSDPLSEISKLARKPNIGAIVQSLSLGQGMDAAAEHCIKEAKKNGEWVVLQNCHLAPGFLSYIERNMDTSENDRFRCWLTSMPTNKFPVAILQNGLKVTTEPPRGIKANLLKAYVSYDNKFLEDLKEPKNVGPWKKLIFGLSFFHAVILERRKFGALGWNIPYQFSQMDMSISISQLKTFLENYEDIEWKALHYLIAEANYGGRVTDPMDRRLIKVILQTYFSDAALVDGYKYSSSDKYLAPAVGNLEGYLEHIKLLPLGDEPDVFGMHSNANITSGINDTNELLAKVLELQPQTVDGGASSADNLIKRKCSEILEALPKRFDLEKAEKDFKVLYEESMNTVLQQELIRFNNLASTIQRTLSQLEKAIEGTIIMSVELEEIYNKMLMYQVPDVWHKVSYPSLKPLTSWFEDFLQRLAFLQKWLDHGQPTSFWISGFFFTQSFLSGTMQNYARKMKKEIDTVVFKFQVMKETSPDQIKEKPQIGCYVYGLYIEAAQWDSERCYLDESAPKILFDKMPMIWMIPTQVKSDELNAENLKDYSCPVYKTSKRAGTLSTTGHSTNYVLSIDLPISKQHKPDHWIKRGVAMLCALDD